MTLSYRWDSISVRAIAMTDYYAEKLSADRLRRCYEIAPPRVRQYLQAEIDHASTKIRAGDSVLELGCGYGRILAEMSGKAGRLVGIDTSRASLSAGREYLASLPNCHLIQADAIRLPFPDRSFDAVLCLQNGLSAFHVDPERLIKESLRVTKPGGIALFSSYAGGFGPTAWPGSSFNPPKGSSARSITKRRGTAGSSAGTASRPRRSDRRISESWPLR